VLQNKTWICVEYIDLNQASPKGKFPLQHINTLVDNIAQFSIFPVMDGVFDYNQILEDA